MTRGPDREPWRITTRWFRRTIAWHIANRPFGTVAGMVQYKHASVAAFEGYTGTSGSEFRAEVEAQHRLGQIDDLPDYIDRRRGGEPLGGPAGPRIARTLDDAAVKFGPLPAMTAYRARLCVMLAGVARTLHVGRVADYFFDPATALCLKRMTPPIPRNRSPSCASRPAVPIPASPTATGRPGNARRPMPRRICANGASPISSAAPLSASSTV